MQMTSDDDLRRELAETQQWLLEHAPHVFEQNEHLREMTIAKAYYHMGKWHALRMVIGLN